MNTILIQTCQSNEISKHRERLEKLVQKNSHVRLLEQECLSKCSFCDHYPYVIFQRQVLFGENVEELFTEIDKELEQI